MRLHLPNAKKYFRCIYQTTVGPQMDHVYTVYFGAHVIQLFMSSFMSKRSKTSVFAKLVAPPLAGPLSTKFERNGVRRNKES